MTIFLDSIIKIILQVAFIFGFFYSQICLSSTDISKAATAYDSHSLANALHHGLIQESGNLAAKTSHGKHQAVQGWFEYSFDVEEGGWFEILVESDRTEGDTRFGYQHEYSIDHKRRLNAINYSGSERNNPFKIGNVWLTKGAHSLRMQNFHWTGFHPITQIYIHRTNGQIGKRVWLEFTEQALFSSTVLRLGEDLKVSLWSDGDFNERVEISIQQENFHKTLRSRRVFIQKTKVPKRYSYVLPTKGLSEGVYRIRIAAVKEEVPESDVRSLIVHLVNTKNTALDKQIFDKKLRLKEIATINCATQEPDYFDNKGIDHPVTKTVASYGLKYRQTSGTGYQQKMNAVDPGWFAYKLPFIRAESPFTRAPVAYLVEVEFPDNEWRSMSVSIREEQEMDQIRALGIDGGGVYSLSGTDETLQMFFWPRRDGAPRIVVQNVRSGGHAACTNIHISQLLNAELPQGSPGIQGGRHFAYWFEEHDRWAGLFGARSKSRDEYREAAKRWMQLVRYLGGDTIMLSAKVYAFSLYPSFQYNITDTNGYAADTLKMLLLLAERYQLRVIVDLHPRALELDWQQPQEKDRSDVYLVDKNGDTWQNVKHGTPARGTVWQQPHFNPIGNKNRQWYKGMVREVAERYGGYSALHGISLRTMYFESKSLNSFHNRDWGYGDYTIKTFQEDTGLDLLKESYQGRFERLNGEFAEVWYRWRSQKIGEIYKDIQQTITNINSTLQLYIPLFGGTQFPIKNPIEAGIDIKILKALPNVNIINGMRRYGRFSMQQDYSKSVMEDLQRYQSLVNNNLYEKIDRPGLELKPNAHLFFAMYLEDGGRTVSNAQIGLENGRQKLWQSPHMQAPGRLALERYAITLAETDTPFIMNGGIGYYFDQPELIPFINEFRHIPNQTFSSLPVDTDGLAVWVWSNKQSSYFYVVNKLGVTQNLSLLLSTSQELIRPATGQTFRSVQNRLPLNLKPFDLFLFKTGNDNRIVKISQDAIPELDSYYSDTILWLEKEAIDGRYSGVIRDKLVGLNRRLKELLEKRRVFAARLLLFSPESFGLFREIRQFPPGYLNGWNEQLLAN